MNQKLLSRKAACNIHGQDSSYFLGWQEYEKNPYDPITNQTGIIQMGLAENQVGSLAQYISIPSAYSILPRVRTHPQPSLVDQITLPMHAIGFMDLNCHGDTLTFPCVSDRFDRDLKWRTGAEIVPIHCSSSNGFRITKPALEAAYQDAKKRSLRVKGVLVTNPSNPLGTTLTRYELDILVDFVVAKDIHLISDEIYSGTNFDSPGFISIAEATKGRDNVSHRIHIVCSLSKDLGLPGFRVGAIYSENEAVVSAATKMSSFGMVSSQTQYLLAALLSDKEFTDKYLLENQKRLKERHDMLVEGLRRIGIRCLKGSAALFCWVDMRHLLKSNTFKGEMELWKKIVYQVGLNISPGSSCHCDEPGWFRVCFANMSEDTLTLAMQRFKSFVDSGDCGSNHDSGHQRPRKQFLTKWVLRLSSTDRKSER
ncbi:hypothetical protein B296_00053263 [Ensete ventricosum]|uniref:1-aminocyclopropane-1-carboxylate synthase n=1 Tax=Ensete ventricosum TaxID=4639 RepID=A0A426X7K4_ENSVE|nr:hypothetical protein B296_00053263 [Ensete ventricosum]